MCRVKGTNWTLLAKAMLVDKQVKCQQPSLFLIKNRIWEKGKIAKTFFFTGDNLEVLRRLQSAYTNKVDVIYIDPPYNTGKDDFAYPDKFEYSDHQLETMFGLNDDTA